MTQTRKIVTNQTLEELFSNRIIDEVTRLSPPLSEGSIHYLTHVLIYFSRSKHLFIDNRATTSLPILAMLYRDAHKANTSYQRNLILRRLGDSALFIGALLYKHFSKKGINKDYFIGMGGGAYNALGDYNYGDTDVFYELADKFPRIIQILATVCANEFEYSANDIFSLLERWRQAKDDVTRKQLQSIGIVPLDSVTRH